MNFLSRLFAGQSRAGILFFLKDSFINFAVWDGARSCWMMNSLSPNLSSMYRIRK